MHISMVTLKVMLMSVVLTCTIIIINAGMHVRRIMFVFSIVIVAMTTMMMVAMKVLTTNTIISVIVINA